MKQLHKRIGSLVLAVCMVLTMLPMTAFAIPAPPMSGWLIASFTDLDTSVKEQTVPLGTAVGELNLPPTLAVTLASATDLTVRQNGTVDVIDWLSIPAYEGSTPGSHVFIPLLDLSNGLVLPPDVTPPTVNVTVGGAVAPPPPSTPQEAGEAILRQLAGTNLIVSGGGTKVVDGVTVFPVELTTFDPTQVVVLAQTLELDIPENVEVTLAVGLIPAPFHTGPVVRLTHPTEAPEGSRRGVFVVGPDGAISAHGNGQGISVSTATGYEAYTDVYVLGGNVYVLNDVAIDAPNSEVLVSDIAGQKGYVTNTGDFYAIAAEVVTVANGVVLGTYEEGPLSAAVTMVTPPGLAFSWTGMSGDTYYQGTSADLVDGGGYGDLAWDIRDGVPGVSAYLLTDDEVFFPMQGVTVRPSEVITTEAQLAAMAGNLGGGYTLGADITLTRPWTPIGNEAAPFTGKLDGGGHTISGLTAAVAPDLGGMSSYAGLFGIVGPSGLVQDLFVEIGAAGISGSTPDGSPSSIFVGGIAGINAGTFSSCQVSGGPISGSGDGFFALGGVAGINTGSINGCQVSVDSISGSGNGVYMVGGIAGLNEGNASIWAGRNTAAVSARGGRTPSLSPSQVSVGGIVGLNRGSVYYSANLGPVYASANFTTQAGGIAGDNESPMPGASDSRISGCVNTGAVTAEPFTGSYPTGGEAGGIAGSNSSTIEECYNTGAIKGTGGDGNVVGGVAGNHRPSSDAAIRNSYNTGTVSADLGSVNYAGGVVGMNGSLIDSTYSVGVVTGGTAGALVGLGHLWFGPDLTPGTLANSYYNSDLAVGQEAIGDNEHGNPVAASGRTTAELMRQATFVGWDFDMTWEIEEGAGYPTLWNTANSDPDPDPKPPISTDDGDDDSAPAVSGNVGTGGAVSQSDITAEAAAALAAPGGTAVLRTQGAQSISPDTLKALAQLGARAGKPVVLYADTMYGGAVQGRLYVRPALLTGATADLLLGVYTEPGKTEAAAGVFRHYFDNNLVSVHFDQQGPLGARLEVAVKVDLSQLNSKTLYFYSYNSATNTYQRIQSPAYWVDTNGYLHFYTALGGDIIITDSPLTLRK